MRNNVLAAIRTRRPKVSIPFPAVATTVTKRPVRVLVCKLQTGLILLRQPKIGRIYIESTSPPLTPVNRVVDLIFAVEPNTLLFQPAANTLIWDDQVNEQTIVMFKDENLNLGFVVQDSVTYPNGNTISCKLQLIDKRLGTEIYSKTLNVTVTAGVVTIPVLYSDISLIYPISYMFSVQDLTNHRRAAIGYFNLYPPQQ